MSDSNKIRAILLLEDGTVYSGVSGTNKTGVKGFGRVVFNTGMVGYQQLLTDPASHGLITIQTFPLVGNYGVNEHDCADGSAHVAGYVVRELCDEPSNYRSQGTLPDFLSKNNVATITNLDTRSITRHIRENGEMKGVIATGDIDIDALKRELFAWEPTPYETANGASTIGVISSEPSRVKLSVIDIGMGNDAFLGLVQMGAEISVLASQAPAKTVIESKPDGIIISNGGGNPSDYTQAIKTIRELAESGIPMLGVGLGHLVMALAMGGEVSKMHCGHRGANQPVYCHQNGRTYITTQNHGYIVCSDKLPEGSLISYKNANDSTVEGISYPDINAQSVQFMPDTTTGIQSTRFVYEDFITQVLARKGK